jgi:hypothetical protein
MSADMAERGAVDSSVPGFESRAINKRFSPLPSITTNFRGHWPLLRRYHALISHLRGHYYSPRECKEIQRPRRILGQERRTFHPLLRFSNYTTLHILVQVLSPLLIHIQPLLKLLFALLLQPLVFKADAFGTQVAFIVASRTGVQDIRTEIGVSSMATSSTEEFVTAVI